MCFFSTSLFCFSDVFFLFARIMKCACGVWKMRKRVKTVISTKRENGKKNIKNQYTPPLLYWSRSVSTFQLAMLKMCALVKKVCANKNPENWQKNQENVSLEGVCVCKCFYFGRMIGWHMVSCRVVVWESMEMHIWEECIRTEKSEIISAPWCVWVWVWKEAGKELCWLFQLSISIPVRFFTVRVPVRIFVIFKQFSTTMAPPPPPNDDYE